MSQSVSRTFPATDEQIPAAQAFVDEALESMDCPPKAAYSLALAFEELVVNVAHYAYAPETGDVHISVALNADGQGATLELRDSGVAFDPFLGERPEVPKTVEELKIGGLGIIMVKEMMDSCEYERTNEQNVVRIGKRWE